MDAKTSIDRFLELRAQYPESYAMWHARIATHGAQNVDNCHPFIVGGDERTYLAHNGVLNVPMAKGEHRSDTRVFAEDVLPAMGGVKAFDNDGVWEIIHDWAGSNKLCILTIDPEAGANIYLVNEKKGEWDKDQVWWSNGYHRPKPVYEYVDWQTGSDYWKNKVWDKKTNRYITIEDEPLKEIESPLKVVPDLDEVVVCEVCKESTDTKIDSFFCEICRSCLDCELSVFDCLCFQSSEWDKRYEAFHEFGAWNY